jgi:hypothetical protein
MPGSGFRQRFGSSVPDAECQDPDFGGESDLLYLMLSQDPDFGGETDLLYLMLNANIRFWAESLIS